MRSNGVEITVVPVHFALLSRAEALPEALEVSHRCHRRHHRMFRIQSFYSDDSPSIHTLTSRARTGEFHPMRDKVCLGNQMTCLSFHKQFRVRPGNIYLGFLQKSMVEKSFCVGRFVFYF